MNRLSAISTPLAANVLDGENYEATRVKVGFVPRSDATTATYADLGFKSGLEIHQQLLTEKKLFCRCPAGVYQQDEYNAKVIRHMRPTLSEMGEYDGTALMEKRTRKEIIYRIKDETACTYDIDDTPPFKINRQALDIAIEIALMLKSYIVGELHITRKQYLDGSIPAGFQRTAIVGIEGDFRLANKKIRIIQLSIEEDSCREVSDLGHVRTYTTDRLGVPLIETVTYPEMLTPDEVAEAAQYLRLLVRTSGKVRTGLGAARQDVNVSIDGGTRVEIKGVAHIKWIPELTHVEAFRQKALLLIRDELRSRVKDSTKWQLASVELDPAQGKELPPVIAENMQPEHKLIAINLPQFGGLLSFFTQPGHCFAGELSDRLKVIACIERPNLIHSENSAWFSSDDAAALSKLVGAKDGDAQLLLWGPADDIKTALETIEERCLLAFDGVPNETRKSLPDGTTIFERVLPGPNRMYPDTDSAPIAIDEARIEQIRGGLVHELPDSLDKLRTWNVPEDAHHYLIVGGLVTAIEEVVAATKWPVKFVALLFAHTLKGCRRKYWTATEVTNAMVVKLCSQMAAANYDRSLAKEALSILCADPSQTLADVIASVPVGNCSVAAALEKLPALTKQFVAIRTSVAPESEARWAVGQLRAELSPDINPGDLARAINGGQANG